MATEIDGIEGVENDYDLYHSLNPGFYTATWNGRTVEKSDYPSNPFFQKPLPFPTLPDPNSIPQSFNRQVEDLSKDPEFDRILLEQQEQFWQLARAAYFNTQTLSENASLEEILAAAGYVFDRQQLDQIVLCRSLWKRITHGIHKGYKKTTHFVKEHKKEILIGGAILAAAIVAPIVAPVIAETGAAVMGALFGGKKKEEEEHVINHLPPPNAPPIPEPQDTLIASAQAEISKEIPSIQKEVISSVLSVNPPSGFSLYGPPPGSAPPMPLFDSLIPSVSLPPPSLKIPNKTEANTFSNTQKPASPVDVPLQPPSLPFQPPTSPKNLEQFSCSLPQIHVAPPSSLNFPPPNHPIISGVSPEISSQRPYAKDVIDIYLENVSRNALPQNWKSNAGDVHHASVTQSTSPAIPTPTNELSMAFPNLTYRFMGSLQEGLQKMSQNETPILLNQDLLMLKDSSPSMLENLSQNFFIQAVGEALNTSLQTVGQDPVHSDFFNIFCHNAQGLTSPFHNEQTLLAERQNVDDFVKMVGEALTQTLNSTPSLDAISTTKAVPQPEIIPEKMNLDYLKEGVWAPSSLILSKWELPKGINSYKDANLHEISYANLTKDSSEITDPKLSCHYKTKGFRVPGIRIGFIPGMNTVFSGNDSFLSHLDHIQKFAGNLSIEGVYNHTNGPLTDLLEIFGIDYPGGAPITGELLREDWEEFHKENLYNPDAKYLQFTHSMGTILARNALEKAPEEIRNRVIIVALGPAVIIPEGLCFKSFHYASKKDIVHYGENLYTSLVCMGAPLLKKIELFKNLSENKSRLILLDPHPDAKGIDHGFEGYTFYKILNDHILDYLIRKGSYEE